MAVNIEEIEGLDGLHRIEKMKVLYEIGYTESFVYIKNLDTNEIKVDWR